MQESLEICEPAPAQRGDLRVAIIGNCHVSGLAASFRALLPGATVKAWHVGLPAATPEEIAAQLPGYDVIVSQLLDLSGQGDIVISRLRETYGASKKVVFIPTLQFAGLQPDAIYMRYKGELLPSEVGVMHSAIVAAAYALEIPQDGVAGLFEASVYSRLGYLNAFETAKAQVLEQFSYYDYDLTEHFARWLGDGRFMHAPTHPRIDVLATLATLAAERAQLIAQGTPVPTQVPDYLASHEQWPIYPEIAEAIGVEGSLLWKKSMQQNASDAERQRTLHDFIAADYELYASHPDMNLLSPRVRFVCNHLKGHLGIK